MKKKKKYEKKVIKSPSNMEKKSKFEKKEAKAKEKAHMKLKLSPKVLILYLNLFLRSLNFYIPFI